MSRDLEARAAPSARAVYARYWLQIAAVAAVAAPAPVLRGLELSGGPHPELASEAQSALFGLSILAAATLLIWTTEVAEQLISATLALAVLAIIAVLPEYAVDLYFAWSAPDDPEKAAYALANMTGANRLLIGFGWSVVFFIFWFRERRRTLEVGRRNAVGVVLLGVATIYAFSIPLRQHLSLVDSVVLIGLFVAYMIISSRAPPREEEELVGPSQAIAALPLRQRWGAIIAIFVFAAVAVFAAAEPFADGLVETGKGIGVDEFILVQWVAPLASEAPEFLLAAILALRGRARSGMTVLISSKVNQWTLLVGSLPVTYAISDLSFSPLPMDSRQVEEVFLTAGQSLFAVAILVSLSFSFREAGILLVLFTTQLVIPHPGVRWGFGVLYVVLALYWLAAERRLIPGLLQVAREETLQAPSEDAGPPGDEGVGRHDE